MSGQPPVNSLQPGLFPRPPPQYLGVLWSSPEPPQPGGCLSILTCEHPRTSQLPPCTQRRWASSGTAAQLFEGPSCGSGSVPSSCPRHPVARKERARSDGSTLFSSLLISPCDLISLPEPGLHLPASSPALLFQACQSGRPGEKAPEASLRDGKWGFSRGLQTEQGSAANRPPSSPSAPVRLAELCLYPQSLGAETHTVMMSTFSEG